VQFPNFSGLVRDLRKISAMADTPGRRSLSSAAASRRDQPIGSGSNPILAALPFRDLGSVRVKVTAKLFSAQPEVLSKEPKLLAHEPGRTVRKRLRDGAMNPRHSRNCGVPGSPAPRSLCTRESLRPLKDSDEQCLLSSKGEYHRDPPPIHGTASDPVFPLTRLDIFFRRHNDCARSTNSEDVFRGEVVIGVAETGLEG
jgi:hypothetical protein